MLRKFFIALSLSASIFCVKAVVAQGLDWRTCGGSDARRAVSACTAILRHPQITSNDRKAAHYNRGNAYYRLQQWDNAIADYTSAIREDANFAAAIYNRSWAYAKRGDRERAIQDYNRARSIDTRYQGRRPTGINFLSPYEREPRWKLDGIRPGFISAQTSVSSSHEPEITSNLIRAKTTSVFFATNRKRLTGEESEDSGELQYGIIELPLDEELIEMVTGDLHAATGFYHHQNNKRGNEDDYHVNLLDGKFKIKLLDSSQYHEELRKCVVDRKASKAEFAGRSLIFIHGFNTSFFEAITAYRNILSSVAFNGCPLIFSWPSQGGALQYGVDLGLADESRYRLAPFLKNILLQGGLTYVDIIAHSLGNRVLMNALMDLSASQWQSQEAGFGEIIMASADVNAKEFLQVAPNIMGMLGRQTTTRKPGLTLLVSQTDNALRLAWLAIRAPRVGLWRAGKLPFLYPNMDTIDISALHEDCWLFCWNHGVSLSNLVVQRDIRNLLLYGTRPPDRRNSLLIPVKQHMDRQRYWRFLPSP